MKIVIDIAEGMLDELRTCKFPIQDAYRFCAVIENGTPLPEGAEILTKEAYSDLCLRASHDKEGFWDVYTDCEGKRTYYTCPFCKNKTNHFMYEPKYCDECGARLKKEGSEADAEKL